MTYSTEIRDCPCIRLQRSPTDGTYIEKPDHDCSSCHGSGEARYIKTTNPRHVRRPVGRKRLWAPGGAHELL